MIQHYETIRQFQNKEKEYEEYLEWFKTLPLFYETENFRAVHACWGDKNISYLKKRLKDNKLTNDLIVESVKKGWQLYEAIEETLKGKEMKMPKGLFFTDKDGTKRTDFRIKWWEDPTKISYKNMSVESFSDLPHQPIDLTIMPDKNFYKTKEKPVFFGHYWLKGQPSLYRNNVCCLDYSVASEGKLVAYSFDGEENLEESKLTFV